MIVCQPTTPAQLFHLLRRQVLSPNKKPLIVFTPKGLLRLKACTNPIEDFTHGSYQKILDDPIKPLKASKLILCSGKIFYDLLEKRDETTAIIRIEELYPLDINLLQEIVSKYKSVKQVFWAQDEPSNMGAFEYLRPFLTAIFGFLPTYAGRERSASSATGSLARHNEEFKAIIDTLFPPDVKGEI
jgi:2-oxoglutarate dehydrogenase E1 component